MPRMSVKVVVRFLALVMLLTIIFDPGMWFALASMWITLVTTALGPMGLMESSGPSAAKHAVSKSAVAPHLVHHNPPGPHTDWWGLIFTWIGIGTAFLLLLIMTGILIWGLRSRAKVRAAAAANLRDEQAAELKLDELRHMPHFVEIKPSATKLDIAAYSFLDILQEQRLCELMLRSNARWCQTAEATFGIFPAADYGENGATLLNSEIIVFSPVNIFNLAPYDPFKLTSSTEELLEASARVIHELGADGAPVQEAATEALVTSREIREQLSR